MLTFDKCFNIIISDDFEGLITTDTSDDLGGHTRCGLTQLNYSNFRKKRNLPDQDIVHADLQEIKEWYKIYCYDNSGAQSIFDCGKDRLSFVQFNNAVQRGYVKAVVTLQDAIGMPYENQTGFFGPITRETVNASIEADVIAKYLQIMTDYFEEHCKQRPDQSKFLAGWLRRIGSVKRIIGS